MTTYCGVEIDVEGPLPVSPLQFGLCHHLVQLMDVEVKGDSQLFCLIQAGLGEGQFEEEVLQCAPEGRREGGEREEGGRREGGGREEGGRREGGRARHQLGGLVIQCLQ